VATFTFVDEFKNKLATTAINLSSDSFKITLTNTLPDVAVVDELADITQIANGNGFLTGGVTLTGVSWAETSAGSGVWRFTSADATWTASGGAIGPWRYVVLYDDTIAGDPLVGILDAGSEITVPDGVTATIDVGTNGWFTLDG
jgi:hypothetical protein